MGGTGIVSMPGYGFMLSGLELGPTGDDFDYWYNNERENGSSDFMAWYSGEDEVQQAIDNDGGWNILSMEFDAAGNAEMLFEGGNGGFSLKIPYWGVSGGYSNSHQSFAPGAKVKNGNAFSFGASFGLAYPKKNYGKGISLGFFFGRGNSFYATKKTGKGIMLSGSLDFTFYENLTSGRLSPRNLIGKGGELDIGYMDFGTSFAWDNNYPYGSTYRAYTLSLSYSMDYGAAIWETNTMILPTSFITNPTTAPFAIGMIYNFIFR